MIQKNIFILLIILGSWKKSEWTKTNYSTKDFEKLFYKKDSAFGILREIALNDKSQSNYKEKKELDKLLVYDRISLIKKSECHRQIR